MSPPVPHSAGAPVGLAPDDALTCAAISSSAYILAAVAHETIGHPAMALLQGGRIQRLTSVYMESTNHGRLIDLGGPLGNLLLAGACLFLLRRRPGASLRARFLLWFCAGCNLLWTTGYLIYSGVTGQGDFAWATVGFEPIWLWRTGLVVLGMLTYRWSLIILIREMRLFLRADASGRVEDRARRIIWIAYLSAGFAACAAAALDPIGPRAIWEFGALSSFVAGLGFLVVPRFLLSQSPGANQPVAAIERDPRWLLVALVMVALFVVVLGRGIAL